MNEWTSKLIVGLCAMAAPVCGANGLDDHFSDLIAVVNAAPAQTQEESQMETWKAEALKAAQEFVDLVDQGNYAESWSRGSAIFQKVIDQRRWTTALQLARAPLGKATSRSLKDERPAWDPKGLPKGAYMVVEYNTSFERAPNSGELLTLRRDPSGVWKVLTYQVN